MDATGRRARQHLVGEVVDVDGDLAGVRPEPVERRVEERTPVDGAHRLRAYVGQGPQPGPCPGGEDDAPRGPSRYRSRPGTPGHALTPRESAAVGGRCGGHASSHRRRRPLAPPHPDPRPVLPRERPVRSVTTAPRGFEGEGFPVRRAFAGVDLTLLDPFIHLDQMGEVDYAPGEPKGTPWHPHRGFETVTYMIDGEMAHQDSNGGGGLITNGDTQWMTAGAGHPAHRDAAGAPRRQRRPVPRLPAVGQPAARPEVGGTALPGHPRLPRSACSPRTTAARSSGSSPARSPGSTRRVPGRRTRRSRSPTPRSRRAPQLTLPWRPDFNALVYALAGRGTVGPDAAAACAAGQLAVLGAGDVADASSADDTQDAHAPELDVLVLGGRPIREPVAWYGPFVMNDRGGAAPGLRGLPGRPPRNRSRPAGLGTTAARPRRTSRRSTPRAGAAAR